MKNLYQVLGITPNAAEKEIKQAYRKLAKKYHPDTNPGDKKAEERFQEITKAYETLIDKDKRQAYDACFSGSKQEEPTMGQRHRPHAAKAEPTGDMQKDLERQFAQFFGAATKTERTKDVSPMDTSDLFGSFFKVKKK